MKENGPPTRFVSIFSLASSTLSLSLLPISFSISLCTYFLERGICTAQRVVLPLPLGGSCSVVREQ